MAFFDNYPYTNWHNVNLDWVLERVKEWGQQVDNLQLSFDNLEAANESFKTYVENYLQDLDVYSEISKKIDELLESGELVTYLQPYISSTVTTWLDENITEPVGVVIDSSLSVAGAAADAKATGDRFSIVERHLFSDEMKDAILNCFEKAGFLFDSIAYKQLQIALFGFSYRYATLDDIFSSVGFDNISISNGTVSPVSVQTFSVLAYNKTFLRFYYREGFAGKRFIFKRDGNNYYTTDGGTIFLFRLSGNKYTSEQVSGFATITYYNGFSQPTTNKLYYIQIENNTFKLSDSDKLLMTISNANIIGYWGSNNETGINLKFREVEILENE